MSVGSKDFQKGPPPLLPNGRDRQTTSQMRAHHAWRKTSQLAGPPPGNASLHT